MSRSRRRSLAVLVLAAVLGGAGVALSLTRHDDFPALWPRPAAPEEGTPADADGASPSDAVAGEAPPGAESESALPGGWIQPADGSPLPSPPLVERMVVEGQALAPPSTVEVITEDRIKAGPVARFYNRGTRVEESEAYRAEIAALPLGKPWGWYRDRLQAVGFRLLDAGWGPREKPRFELERQGLHFRLEVTIDSRGGVTTLDAGPNL